MVKRSRLPDKSNTTQKRLVVGKKIVVKVTGPSEILWNPERSEFVREELATAIGNLVSNMFPKANLS